MEFEPNYGSSEYSTKAEELFAGYLLDAEGGAVRDFEDFCAEHDSYADELYGLHADWDNVRGLLAQLKGRRVESTPAPAPPAPEPQPDRVELAKREAAIEPFSAADVPDPDDEYDGRPNRAWKVLATGGALVAVVTVIWAAQLSRNTQVLAREKQSLVDEQDSTRKELESVRTESRALAEREAQLSTELSTEREAKGQIETDRDALNADLEKERARQQELAAEHEQLGAALALERTRSETALQAAREARVQVTALALRARGEQLMAREASLWPSSAERLTPLGEWLADAEQFAGRWRELEASSSAALEGSEQLAPLLAADGLIEQSRERHAAMQVWQAEAIADVGSTWAKALDALQDPERSPLYRGLQLTPQFALSPLGPDPQSGLWRFADRQTESPAGSNALVFVLVPGIELEGNTVPPFFVSESEWTPEQRDAIRPGGAGQDSDDPLRNQIEYELDLLRLGYEPLSGIQAGLARHHGLDAATWKSFPVRALR